MMLKRVQIIVGILLFFINFDVQAKKKQIGIFPFQSVEQSLPPQELETLSNQFVAQLEQSGKYDIIKKYPLAGGLQPPSPKAIWEEKRKVALIEINQILNQSAELVRAGDFERAIPLLKQGLKKAVQNMKWKKSFSALSRMCGLLALAYLQLGQNDEGEFLLKALAIIQPKPLPPEIKSNRIMLFRYKRMLRDIHSLGVGQLKIEGTSGASVLVDGKPKGTIPLTIQQLPKGIHYIQVYKKGYLPWGKALKISANFKTKIYLQQLAKPTLSPLEKARRELITSLQLLNLNHKEFRQAALLICQKMNIETLISANIKKANIQYLITPVRINCRNGKYDIFEPMQLDGELLETEPPLRKMGKLLLEPPKKIVKRPPPKRRRTIAITPPRQRVIQPPQRREEIPPIQQTKKSLHEQWWFWTIVGTTVVGAGVATTVILLQPPKLNVTATWSTNQ